VNHLDKINNIAGFALPCVVFFVVFESGCNIEKHLVTLNKFYEDDADWAQEQLDGSKFFSEELIRKSAQAVQDRLQSNDDDFTLDSLLDETIRGTTVSHGHLTESNAQHSGKADLFTGLWPGGILLLWMERATFRWAQAIAGMTACNSSWQPALPSQWTSDGLPRMCWQSCRTFL